MLAALASTGFPTLARAARVLDVRVGDHPDFTRIVFELDERVPYRLELLTAERQLRVTVDAAAPALRVSPKSQMVEEVAVQAGDTAAVADVRLSGPVPEIKEWALTDPPRIVLDLMRSGAPATTPSARSSAPKQTQSASAPKQTQSATSPEDWKAVPGEPAPQAAPAQRPAPKAAPAPPPPDAQPTPPLPAAPPPPPRAEREPPRSDLPAATKADGAYYPLSTIEILYIDPNPNFPTVGELEQIPLEVGQSSDGLVAPREGVPTVPLSLAELRQMPLQAIYASAIRAIAQQLVYEFNRRDFHAIVVSPVPEDVERRTGRDLRPPGETRLRLGVYAGRVKDLRTFASGERYDEDDEKLDLPRHAWILEDSPVTTAPPDDLVRKDELDEYLARLNRYPSRRVDADISPARTAGGVNLDYMVSENKPWYVFTQLDNTGTEETTILRQRFGFAHQQLFGRDDTLQLDYVTGNFDEVQGVLGSYEAPIIRGGRFRVRAFGSWSRYDASVLGQPDIAGQDPFTGKQVDTGLQLSANIFQHQEFFLDAVLGAHYLLVDVKNELSFGDTHEKENFALGYVGLRMERFSTFSSVTGELIAERNFAGIAGTDGDDLPKLGRLAVNDPDFATLRWDLDTSVFIDPLLSPRSWQSPTIYETKSLAHELYLSFRGQQAINAKLIPQQEAVVGGLYTVRGYPEAAVVGDNAQVFTAEYRLHIPRLFSPGKPVQVPVLGPVRARPQYQYSFADWDLILRGFVDVGHTGFYKKSLAEENQTLVGTGIGLEVRLKRYITALVDWGIALKSTNPTAAGDVGTTDAGDSRVNFLVRILY